MGNIWHRKVTDWESVTMTSRTGYACSLCLLYMGSWKMRVKGNPWYMCDWHPPPLLWLYVRAWEGGSWFWLDTWALLSGYHLKWGSRKKGLEVELELERTSSWGEERIKKGDRRLEGGLESGRGGLGLVSAVAGEKFWGVFFKACCSLV